MLDQSGVTDSLEESLRAVGLTSNEARAYLALLRLGSVSPSQLVPKANVSRGRVYQILAELERKGFVVEVPGPTRAYRPVDPVVALGAVLEAETSRARGLERLVGAVTPKLEELRGDQADRRSLFPAVEVLARPEQFARRFRQLEEDATEEILLFTKAPLLLHGNFEELQSLRRGVRCASIYEKEIVEDPSFREGLEVWMESGEEARVVDHLPTKMAVFDRKLALLPLASVEDPAAPHTLVVVHDAGLAQTLAVAFDHLWQQAEVIAPLSKPAMTGRPDVRSS